MRKLKTKYNLFRFKDGTIVDVSKIDLIKERDAETAVIYISGTQLSIDRDDEFEKLIGTWDAIKRMREQNEEILFKYLESIDLRIRNLDLYLKTK